MSDVPPLQGFDKLIGLELTSITGDEVRASLPVTADLLQPSAPLREPQLAGVVERQRPHRVQSGRHVGHLERHRTRL